MTDVALQALAPDLWVASRPLPMWVGDVGCRMTIVRTEGDLLLHSPIPLDATTRSALDSIGRVRWIVGPNRVHHFWLGDYAQAYPDALLCGAPGLAEKRRDLHFQRVLDDSEPPPWGPFVRIALLRGAPRINELAFFHPASRTLVLTDFAFNVRRTAGARVSSTGWSARPAASAPT